jgi:hypothetical protein
MYIAGVAANSTRAGIFQAPDVVVRGTSFLRLSFFNSVVLGGKGADSIS